MTRAVHIAAKALSIILYPLLIPTYGVGLFCYAFSHQVYPLPPVWTGVAVVGTLVLTLLLPVTAIGILIRQGKVKDLEITDAKQRTLPYLYTVFGFGCWWYLMHSILHAPTYITLATAGATLAIILVSVINRHWKISAHLSGTGGLVGGLMSYYAGIGVVPSWGVLSFCLTLSLLLMYARVRLEAHTPAQVCAGWLLGMACTFLPYGIYSYVV